RAGVAKQMVDEVIVGNVGQYAEKGFIGRMCSLKAGLPKETTAYSLNRQCASGLNSVANAVMAIQTGHADIIVACGTENMNQAPYYLRKARFGYRMGHDTVEDGLIHLLTWPMGPFHNGITAENVAEAHGITREMQDEFALLSQERALRAIEDGRFKDEIVAVEIPKRKGQTEVFDTDEHPRKGLTLEKLAKLKPAFKQGGTVTAANSSGINDGAAAVVLMSREKAAELGIDAKVKIVDWAFAGNDAALMGFAPAISTRKLMDRVKMHIDDFDLIELNEAFASQSVAVINDLNMDLDKVNVNGGAIALGHPVGATGTILVVKIMNEMKRRNVQTGLIAMCVGGGQGMSLMVERVSD
ncbi:MAG: thiolase family protein, partial [Deltaproteobacteria bacterium]|nr:thiolase family protein [Deltaproteobacteria bacterium]